MNVQQAKQQKGFTIIEVILVLAIAALIFLMVFIALPALQRGQRDTARKNDVGDIASAVTNYTSNNNGTFPTSAQLKTYVNNDVSSNTDLTHLTVANAGGSASVKVGYVTVTKGTKCGATGAASNGTATQTLTTTNVAASAFTVTTFLESGGGTSFCQNS